MHKYLPNSFVYLDQYNNFIFKNNNINLGIIYRNYHSKNREIELCKIAKACKKKKIKLYVSNSMKLTLKFKADGLYVPSFNKNKRYNNFEKKNLLIIGSAHNQKEIHEKIKQNCSALFLSPIFYVKKNSNYLDIYKFNLLSINNKINFFALGGINENNITKLNLLNVKGYGGVSWFKKKPAYKRPVFLKNKFF
jgi:thiamine-phosphate pyrophosphorylase